VIDPGDKKEILALLAERQARTDAREEAEETSAAEEFLARLKTEDRERWIVERGRFMRRRLTKLHEVIRDRGAAILPPEGLAELMEAARARNV
jgi:hypothetical protein